MAEEREVVREADVEETERSLEQRCELFLRDLLLDPRGQELLPAFI